MSFTNEPLVAGGATRAAPVVESGVGARPLNPLLLVLQQGNNYGFLSVQESIPGGRWDTVSWNELNANTQLTDHWGGDIAFRLDLSSSADPITFGISIMAESFSGSESVAGVYIDDFVINGVTIPSPSSLTALYISICFTTRRQRRN